MFAGPLSKIGIPSVRIGLINRDDLDPWTRWITALNMQGTPGCGTAQDQATWTVFVIRVIFDNATGEQRFPYLRHGNISE